MKKIFISLIVIASIAKQSSQAQIITTIAGNGYGAGTGMCGYSGDSGQASLAELCEPTDVALDATGNIYISDYSNNRIRKVNAGGIITTIAGNGTAGFSGDGGQATTAEVNNTQDLTIDASGNIYFADAGNNRVRKINTLGIITTIVGTGIGAYSGDGGQAIAAELYGPGSLTFDVNGNLYIADGNNNRIRKVNTSGIISLISNEGVVNKRLVIVR